LPELPGIGHVLVIDDAPTTRPTPSLSATRSADRREHVRDFGPRSGTISMSSTPAARRAYQGRGLAAPRRFYAWVGDRPTTTCAWSDQRRWWKGRNGSPSRTCHRAAHARRHAVVVMSQSFIGSKVVLVDKLTRATWRLVGAERVNTSW